MHVEKTLKIFVYVMTRSRTKYVDSECENSCEESGKENFENKTVLVLRIN